MSEIVAHVPGREVLMRFFMLGQEGFFWVLVILPLTSAGTRGVVRAALVGN